MCEFRIRHVNGQQELQHFQVRFMHHSSIIFRSYNLTYPRLDAVGRADPVARPVPRRRPAVAARRLVQVAPLQADHADARVGRVLPHARRAPRRPGRPGAHGLQAGGGGARPLGRPAQRHRGRRQVGGGRCALVLRHHLRGRFQLNLLGQSLSHLIDLILIHS